MRPFEIGFFHSAYALKYWCILIICSFLLLSNILWCGCVTVHSSPVSQTNQLFAVIAYKTAMSNHRFLCEHMLLFLCDK